MILIRLHRASLRLVRRATLCPCTVTVEMHGSPKARSSARTYCAAEEPRAWRPEHKRCRAKHSGSEGAYSVPSRHRQCHGKIAPLFWQGSVFMRSATCCLLVVLFGSWSSSLGQKAPKFTTSRIVERSSDSDRRETSSPPQPTHPRNEGPFDVLLSWYLLRQTASRTPSGRQPSLVKDKSGQHGPDYPFGDSLYTQVRPNTLVYEFPFRAEAGQPMQVEVYSAFGNTAGSKYNVFFVAEQLM